MAVQDVSAGRLQEIGETHIDTNFHHNQQLTEDINEKFPSY